MATTNIKFVANRAGQEAQSYCVLLLASELAWCLEVDTQIREVSFIVLRCIFDSVDVKWGREPMDG